MPFGLIVFKDKEARGWMHYSLITYHFKYYEHKHSMRRGARTILPSRALVIGSTIYLYDLGVTSLRNVQKIVVTRKIEEDVNQDSQSSCNEEDW